MSDIVPRSQLTKQGVKGVGAVAGGVALIALSGGGLFGILLGGAVALVGIALSGSKSERTAGITALVVGIAALVSSLPVLRGLFGWLHWLMRAAGFVLIGGGVWSLVRFFGNLRKRA